MTTKYLISKIYQASILTILSLTISAAIIGQTKLLPENLKDVNNKAQVLVKQGKYLQALPLMEQLVPYFKDNGEFMAQYGIAVVSNSVVLETPKDRKEERLRGLAILKTAKSLGTENVKALYFLDVMPEDGGNGDEFDDDNSVISQSLREGEGYFGRGEYEKAFAAYEKAYKLDPKNYEAIVFMGDSLYAQKKYEESESWFAKAAELQPNREMAYRYWGDALLYQKRYAAALDKFAEAMIAEPFSRMTWDSFQRWGELSKAEIDLIEITPPGNKNLGEIIVDEKLLKTEDGTDFWRLYNEVRLDQIKKNSIKNTRHNLNDEAIAWKKVADGVRDAIKKGSLKNADKNLIRLIEIADAGLLEPYILFLRGQPDFNEDYENYRDNNRPKMKRFIIEFMFGVVKPEIERNVT